MPRRAVAALLVGAGALATARALAATPAQVRAPAATTQPATQARATPHRTRGRDEIGLRLGAALPFCDAERAPHFGPAARLQVLFATTRAFKLGASVGYARFSYIDTSIPARESASTATARFLMRLYPVMGQRLGLYFDLGVGLAHATQSGNWTGGNYTTDSPTLGLGAGIPIAVARWLRLAPYAAGLFHVSSWGETCAYPANGGSAGGGVCYTRPAHSGFFGFGLETTVLFGR